MSTETPIYKFIKSQTGDNIGKTIGEDLPANWDKVEAQFNNLVADKLDKTTIEDGIWTPIISGNVVAGSNTYSVQNGNYFKVGKLVFIRFALRLSSKDAAMDGDIRISGLPFAMNGNYAANFAMIEGITMPSGFTTDYSNYLSGTSINLRALSNGSWNSIKATNVGNTAILYGSATYLTN